MFRSAAAGAERSRCPMGGNQRRLKGQSAVQARSARARAREPLVLSETAARWHATRGRSSGKKANGPRQLTGLVPAGCGPWRVGRHLWPDPQGACPPAGAVTMAWRTHSEPRANQGETRVGARDASANSLGPPSDANRNGWTCAVGRTVAELVETQGSIPAQWEAWDGPGVDPPFGPCE